ncbi:MAG: zinc-ribbon domain containing protein [Chloroflexi bacterium]|nr:zinc-ribbon domain containing protein [Chloroflexota bacterium]
MQDKTLTCRDCNNEFVFTAGEQDFFASQGFQNEPSRCPDCRATRKQRQSQEGGFRGGNGSYDRRPRQMFPAVCSTCQQQTEVPFQPRNDKPVYCSSCFETQRGSVASRGRRSDW